MTKSKVRLDCRSVCMQMAEQQIQKKRRSLNHMRTGTAVYSFVVRIPRITRKYIPDF